jgi:hypothetical protein
MCSLPAHRNPVRRSETCSCSVLRRQVTGAGRTGPTSLWPIATAEGPLSSSRGFAVRQVKSVRDGSISIRVRGVSTGSAFTSPEYFLGQSPNVALAPAFLALRRAAHAKKCEHIAERLATLAAGKPGKAERVHAIATPQLHSEGNSVGRVTHQRMALESQRGSDRALIYLSASH